MHRVELRILDFDSVQFKFGAFKITTNVDLL